MIQEILVIASLVIALFYIGFRAYKKITDKNKCGGDNCGCH